MDHSVYERFTSNSFLKFGCRANGRSCEEIGDDDGLEDENDDYHMHDDDDEGSAPSKKR